MKVVKEAVTKAAEVKDRRKFDAMFKREAVALWLNSGKSPLDMNGAGESPSEQPQGDQPGNDAADQHESLTEQEQIGAGDDERFDDDAEPAGDHDRGTERGDEDRNWMVPAVAGTRVGFRVHGRPNSGDALESTRGLMVRTAALGRSSP